MCHHLEYVGEVSQVENIVKFDCSRKEGGRDLLVNC